MNILAIDIGGTAIKYAYMTQDMKILSKGKVKTPQEGRNELIEQSDRFMTRCQKLMELQFQCLESWILKTDNCVMGGALRYNDDFYLQEQLYKRCPVDIWMENDAKCAAMAEAATGSLKDVKDGFVLIFGTMIGGGFIKDRKLYKQCH